MLGQKLNPYWDALAKRQQEKLKVEQSAKLHRQVVDYNTRVGTSEGHALWTLFEGKTVGVCWEAEQNGLT